MIWHLNLFCVSIYYYLYHYSFLIYIFNYGTIVSSLITNARAEWIESFRIRKSSGSYRQGWRCQSSQAVLFHNVSMLRPQGRRRPKGQTNIVPLKIVNGSTFRAPNYIRNYIIRCKPLYFYFLLNKNNKERTYEYNITCYVHCFQHHHFLLLCK